tara:strand:+ start:50 stop:790 length:741 start_codon:yes stop_codon:yes gene_type:complete
MNTPVYFVSDIHLKIILDNDELKRREKLYRFLDIVQETGGTCFFLGDLFDFYFEYQNMIPKAYSDFYHKAKSLRDAGVSLHFLVGNHDYWVGDYIKNSVMDQVYFGDGEFKINGKRFFLTHGDGLLSWDKGYRVLKKIIRSKTFIWLFHLIHPTISYKIANFISRSGNYNNHDADFNNDVRSELQKIAKNHFDNGFDYMISGHYHLGEMYKINSKKLTVLGDWFFKPSYAVFDGNDLELISWEHDE